MGRAQPPPGSLRTDWHVPLAVRRLTAQQIGVTRGNRVLQRLLAPTVQRSGERTLRLGAQGDDVKALQERLVERGASLAPDGVFGPKTRSAVVSFQQSAGLAADGVVGPRTWAALQGQGATVEPGPATAGSGSAKLVELKLQQVNALLQLLGRSGGAAGVAETPTGPSRDLEVPMVGRQGDAKDGEESSWIDDVTGGASDAWDAVTDAAESVGDAAGDAWETIKETAGEGGQVVADAWDEVKDTVAGVGATVGEIAGGVGTEVGGAVGAAVEEVTSVASDVTATVEQLADDVADRYAAEISGVKEFLNDVAYYATHPVRHWRSSRRSLPA